MEAILRRRSIRKFTDEEVSNQDLMDLLQAAMAAPSAGNEQPWHFIIIKDKQIFEEIPKFHEYSAMLKYTSAAIVVCGDPTLQKYNADFWVQDCSAATQNILIAAQAKGLGTVWLGIYPIEERVTKLQDLLGLPEHVIPLAIIPVGHPAEERSPSNRFKEARIRYNHW